jgi:hypothetical protein
MILGYPGRTSRYLSSTAVEAQQHQLYPRRQRYFAELIRLLTARGQDDPSMKLRLSSNIKSFANVEKNARGMMLGLARNRVVERKLKEEAEFGAWLESQSDARPDLSNVLRDVLLTDSEEASTAARDSILVGFFGNARLFSLLMDVVQAFEPESSERRLRALETESASESLTANVDWLEAPLMELLLKELQDLPKDQQISGLSTILGAMSPSEFVKMAYENSDMLSSAARKALISAGRDAVHESADPSVRLAVLLGPIRHRARNAARELQARRHVQNRKWIEAQELWRGKLFYPDANSTLRVSAATVKGYSPRDGVLHSPFTSLSGLLDKETGEEPFASPDTVLNAAKIADKSRFRDQDLKDIPVCFLADGDTTGGNSGSPVINGKGQLVGLNFDRVFENVAGDYGWNPERSRNICVDIRFVLWNLEQVAQAPDLLKELGFN